MTGTGFYTTIEVPASVMPLEGLPDLELNEISGKAPGVEHGMDFILFIRSGMVEMLEGYTYGEERWPDKTEDIELLI